ncbi:MAG: hypothetical protein AAFU85_33215 [Planctomycetota bacterium]
MTEENRDPFAEIDAMKAVATALQGLDDDAIARIVRWQIDQYGVEIGGVRPKRKAGGNAGGGIGGTFEEIDAETPSDFESAAELMAAAKPSTDVEKVLVTAYWFQVMQNQSDLESQSINTELKHQGHGVKNITTAFDGLMSQKPQLAIQLRKSGTSRQARKKYKLTTEGIQKVRRMIAGTNGNGEDE